MFQIYGARRTDPRVGFFLSRQSNHSKNTADQNLAYLPQRTEHFNAYWNALMWAQKYARTIRDVMLDSVIEAVRGCDLPDFEITFEVVNCHHNYAALESHYGENVYVTRKGAVRAREGDLGIIPGSIPDPISSKAKAIRRAFIVALMVPAAPCRVPRPKIASRLKIT